MATIYQSGVVWDSITKNGKHEPFELQVGRGLITNHQNVEIFGYSTQVGGTALGPLWEGLTQSGGTYAYPGSAGVVVLLSASGATDAGLIIQVNGLDSSYNLLSETVTLNGSGTATTTNSFLRINGLFITNGVNAGNITAKIATVLYAQINAGIGQTQMSLYTVPKGYTFYLTYIQANASIGFTSSNYMIFAEYNKFNLASTSQENGYNYTLNGNTTLLSQSPFVQIFNIPYTVPVGHPGGTDLQFQMKSNSGGPFVGSIFAGGYLIADATATTF
jgi:hypothetical protein